MLIACEQILQHNLLADLQQMYISTRLYTWKKISGISKRYYIITVQFKYLNRFYHVVIKPENFKNFQQRQIVDLWDGIVV